MRAARLCTPHPTRLPAAIHAIKNGGPRHGVTQRVDWPRAWPWGGHRWVRDASLCGSQVANLTLGSDRWDPRPSIRATRLYDPSLPPFLTGLRSARNSLQSSRWLSPSALRSDSPSPPFRQHQDSLSAAALVSLRHFWLSVFSCHASHVAGQ